MKRSLLIAAACMCMLSCGENKSASNTTTTNNDSMAMQEQQDSIEHARLKAIALANEKDPVCEMPVTRGPEDTTLYDGKVIGFCSKECKKEFLEKPASYKIQ